AVLLMKTNKDGTYKERKRRAFVLDKMLHELYALKQTPALWQDLETQHIHSVIKRWKDQRVKPSTIMRYMTIIRKVLADLIRTSRAALNKINGVTKIRVQTGHNYNSSA